MMLRALVWAFCLPMLPVCWLQGLYLRRRQVMMSSPTLPLDWTRIEGSEPKVVRVLGLGDSVMAGYGLNAIDLGCLLQALSEIQKTKPVPIDWRVVAEKGAKARALVHQFEHAKMAAVDIVVVSVGVNDVSSLTSLLKWQRAIFDFVMTVRQHTQAHIVFIGLPPMAQFEQLPQPLRGVLGVRARLLDEVLKRSVEGLLFADHLSLSVSTIGPLMAADGYHPSEVGHHLIGAQLAQVCLTALAKRGEAKSV